jgi:hypothetical protein
MQAARKIEQFNEPADATFRVPSRLISFHCVPSIKAHNSAIKEK